MKRTSTPGKTDSGAILVDVMISIGIISIALLPIFSTLQKMEKSIQKQDLKINEIVTLIQNQPDWYARKTVPEE